MQIPAVNATHSSTRIIFSMPCISFSLVRASCFKPAAARAGRATGSRVGPWQPRCVEVARERRALERLTTEDRFSELAKLPIAISANLSAECVEKLERQRATLRTPPAHQLWMALTPP